MPVLGPVIALSTIFLLWMRDRQVEQEKQRKAAEAKKQKKETTVLKVVLPPSD